MTATLVSVNVGLPADVEWQGRTVRTGAWKAPVAGPRLVRRLNVDGDGQGDLAGHGGEIRAVLVYQLQSYAYWREELRRDDLTFGMFGENFTVDGLPDDEVCIGDRYRIGDAEFEVTQPRVTCYRVGLRLGEPRMASLLVAHHRPGFYLRVLTEGQVQAGDPISLISRGPEELSVAETDALLYLPGRDPAMLRRALNIPALSPGWRRSFLDLANPPRPSGAADDTRTGDDTGAAERRGWPGFRPLRVTGIDQETPVIASVRLASTDGSTLPAALPGQFLSVRVAADGEPTVRSYSLSSAPGADEYRISVKREPHGTVSGYLHARLRVGDVLDVASPRGAFVLEAGVRPVLLVSAGIGATPVLAMLHQLAEVRDPRPVWWIHTARNRALHAFAAEAHVLLARLPDAHEHVFYTAADDDQATDGGATDATAGADAPAEPQVTHGRLTARSLTVLGLPADADAYLCGPVSFMDDVSDHLRTIGLAPERIRTEQFGSLAAVNPGITTAAAARPHRPPGPPGTGPLVTFARSGITTRWQPEQASLLTLAEACDIPTRWSCRTGVCHTCVTPVLSGTVVYTTEPLEPAAPGEALVCCSRPGEDVVLDL
ncbi:MOSC and FAD-binding oxidoreductase domain-containing protein [Streptacidiphilus neutrinimicus]|uniref:MOSC and FAD-binding oxidoreductase domain-containing protein n=1 Tax=Streptacidiphilus neutrinimicus TaxID=105420 RepID=UPI0005A7A602|nr:MOSC and FAD-binding oxidoreductase domain-containing protein [Streptacidiphilus neutrinimicus]